MKERYSRFMDNLTPERSDGELLKTVLEKADKKEKIKMANRKIFKKAATIPIAAAAALALSVAGGAAIYSGLSYLQTSELAKSTEVAESIQTEVFTDSTEHIKITVEEYVSDGISAFATVKYEALDDYGKEWLADKHFDNELLCLKPCTLEFGSDFGGVSHSFGNREIEELKTATERYFMVTLNCNGDEYDGGIAFCYAMNNYDFREAPFEKRTIELKSYTLSGDGQASEYFTPTHLKISDLSFVVYGENHGAYERITAPNYTGLKSTIPEEEAHELHSKLNPTIIKTNGERIELATGFAVGSADPAEGNFYTDLTVCTGDFSRYDHEKNEWVYYSIDSEDIAGIEICGVYYEAAEIE